MFLCITGLLVKRESRTELFNADVGNGSHDEDRYDQLFMQASRRIDDDVAASLPGPMKSRSGIPSRNFFDDV